MKKSINIILISTVYFISILHGCTPYRNYKANIEINNNTDSYILTTSESDFKLIMPKNNLTPNKTIKEGATQNPRYFCFADEKSKLVVSGWFEPSYLYPGAKKHFVSLVNQWDRNGVPRPQNPEYIEHGKWRIVFYETPCNSNNTPNIIAHFFEKDTWIEIHISYECNSGMEVTDLLEYLDTLLVVSK